MEGLNEAREVVKGQVAEDTTLIGQMGMVTGLSFCNVKAMNEARLIVQGMLSRAKESGEELARSLGKK